MTLVLRRFGDVVTARADRTRLPSDAWQEAVRLTPESLVEFRLTEGEQEPHDLLALRILSQSVAARDETPALDTRYELRHLRIRDPRFSAIFRIKHAVVNATRDFLNEQGLIFVTPPVVGGLTEACEDVSTLFGFDYFGHPLFLSQSAQLYKEALIYSVGGVYTIYPSFRAERVATPRHLNEYTHIEVEIPFLDWQESMGLQERLVHHVVAAVLADYERDLAALGRSASDLEPALKPFPRLSYSDAIALLQEQGCDIQFGDDLDVDTESILTQEQRVPLFVTNYPLALKGFYVKADPEHPELALNSDLLAPGGLGEMIGGSEREEDFRVIHSHINTPRQRARIQDLGGTTEDYNWYLELRKYGSVQHSGFGLGCERMVRWLCGLDHIMDATPFPRTLETYHP